MRQADVLRALHRDGDRAVDVVLEGESPLDAFADGLKRVRPDAVVVAVSGGPASFVSVADIVVVANRFDREVVGVVPLDDGACAILLRATTSDDLLDRVSAWDATAMLRAVTQERDNLQRRLDRILQSRAYRLARRMASMKRRVAELIHRG